MHLAADMSAYAHIFPPPGHDHLMSQDVYEGLKYFTIE